MPEGDLVYLLVDGENIDRTLGQILEAKPKPEQRPRWERVRGFAERTFGRPARALFFLNAWRGLPGTFIQALRIAGYVPIPLSGAPDQKVVDIAMIRTLEALSARKGDVVVVSHDADFREALAGLAGGGRRLGVLAFREYLGGEYVEIPGLEVFDLEDDANAFDGAPLPRVRVIPIDQFDPSRYL
ncbi:MAG: NYN domain-containing protein [Planctomycetes bacterium]|nr:NYN domain-containing protein [Planctomycetota bacterium]